jgi:hypothetical protein
VISNLYVYQLLAGERMREAQEAAARDALARQAAARTPSGAGLAGAVRLWLPWHELVPSVSLRRR